MANKDEIFHVRKRKSILRPILIWFFIFLGVALATGFVFWYFLKKDLTTLYKEQNFWLLQVVIDGTMLVIFLFTYRIDAQNIALKYSSTEDAHWALKKDLAKAKEFTVTKLSEIGNVEDGVLIEAKKANSAGTDLSITLTSQMHAMIIGTTGSGKSTGYVDQTLEILSKTKNPPSFIISDPKGDLYEQHCKTLEKTYDVTLLDLRNPYNSSHWNPFSVLRRRIELLITSDECVENQEHYVDGKYVIGNRKFDTIGDVKIYQQILVDEINDNAKDIIYNLCPIKGRDPLWESGSRDLIVSVLLCFCDDCRAGIMDLDQLTLYNLFYNFTQYTDDISKIKSYVLEGHADNLLAKSYGQQVLLAEDKTLMSFKSTLVGYINKLADQGILAMTSENEINFSTLDEGKPKAIFLAIPTEKETRYELPRIFVSQAYKELVAKANENKIYQTNEIIDRSTSTGKLSRTGKTKFNQNKEEKTKKSKERIDIQRRIQEGDVKEEQNSVVSDEQAILNQTTELKSTGKAELKRKVYFVLDEFGNLPKFEDIKKMVAVGRSMGARFLFVLQDYAQLDDVYGKEESKILQSNCNVKVYIGTQDEGTLKAFSDLCGNRRVAQKSINTNMESNPSSSTSVTTMPLISPAELSKLNGEGTDKGQAVICVYGFSPIHSEFTPSFLLKKLYFPGGSCSSIGTFRAKGFDVERIQYDMMKKQNEIKEAQSDAIPSNIIGKPNATQNKPAEPQVDKKVAERRKRDQEEFEKRNQELERHRAERERLDKMEDEERERYMAQKKAEREREVQEKKETYDSHPIQWPKYAENMKRINECFRSIQQELSPFEQQLILDAPNLKERYFRVHERMDANKDNSALTIACNRLDAEFKFLEETTDFLKDCKEWEEKHPSVQNNA